MGLGKLKLAAISTTAIAMVAACTQQSVETAETAQNVTAPVMEQVELVKGTAATTAADGSETLGFAFTYFWFSVHETPEDCPDGYAMALRDVAIMHLPQERQNFLLKAENRSTYYKMGYALSAKRMKEQNGQSICNIPNSYDDPDHRVVQSNVSYGRDLDGVTSEGEEDDTTCGTNDFVSPEGVQGVDNELYRVMGCVDSFRRDAEFAGGAMEDYHVGSYRDGETTTLMEIRGVDDRMNDDDVTVGVYSSADATPFDSQKNGIGFASMSVTDNTLWHNEVKGKIVDGELITEPFDMRLKFGWSGRPAEYKIKESRIHLTLKEDGTAEGDLAGYFDTLEAYRHNFHNARGALEVANGFTCPAVWDSIQKYSDGHKDPKTGKCTTISSAMTIQAVPAFLIQPAAEDLTKYVLDTTEYYGVSLEEIAVEGAEVRSLKGAGRPKGYKSERELAEEAKKAKAAKAAKESAK